MDPNQQEVSVSKESIKFWEHPWFWWLIVSVFYWVMLLAGPREQSMFGDSYVTQNKIAYVLGLFTPIGPNNKLFFIILLPLIAIGLAFGEFILRKYRIRTYKAIVFSFLLLLVITMLGDLILFRSWLSLSVFWKGF